MKPNELDRIVLFALYSSLYVNDIACNSIKDIAPYIVKEDKEATKIYGALKKRVNAYLEAINDIMDCDIWFFADFNGRMDDIINKDIMELKDLINNFYRHRNVANRDLITATEISRVLVSWSIEYIKELKSKTIHNLRLRNLDAYILYDINRVLNNFSLWINRKNNYYGQCEKNKDIFNVVSRLCRKLGSYENFVKCWNYATELKKHGYKGRSY